MTSIEYFFNDSFIINADVGLYTENTTPVNNEDYDYILTFPGDLADYFTVKTYKQESSVITYVPMDINVPNYLGSNAIGNAKQGSDVYLSKDGLVMVIGGKADDSDNGAVWVWTRVATTWTEATKLVGTGASGAAQQGSSVALSNNGSTIAIGGPNNDSGVGAVWIFQLINGVWTEEQLLIPNNNTGNSNFGVDVALSGDGDTLVVGGNNDDNNTGAVWVFTRNTGVWTQIDKISENASGANQGTSVAISEDGTTLVFGGPTDNSNDGAVWVYNLSGGSWVLDTKIVGTLEDSSAVTGANQGTSVQISRNGLTIAFGGPSFYSDQGGVWIWVYENGGWSQQAIISSTNYNIFGITPRQGYSVTLSNNGGQLVFATDNSLGTGSIWIYSRNSNDNTWTEKDWLIYSDSNNISRERMAVTMSGDGKILSVSAPNDSNYIGIIWSFIDSASATGNALDQLTKYVDVALVFNTDYYNGVSATTGYNNVGIIGGKTDVISQGMYGLEDGLDFDTRVLEILAIKIFGHARARAAIFNDTDIITGIKDDLSNHIVNVVNKYKYDIFNQYVQTDNPNMCADDITNPVDFNFQQDTLSFPGFITGNLNDKSRLSNELLEGPNVGGNLMIDGDYNIPILIRIGSV